MTRISAPLVAFAVCSTLALSVTGHAQAPASPPTQTAPAKKYTPASVKAAPDLACKLHAPGSAPDSGLAVFTDGDGYARFHAVRAGPGVPVQPLVLSCTDQAGRASQYSVDLSSDETFANRPVNIANERGVDRPALAGDPLSYTQAQLSRDGYGLRPDPAAAPAAYASWREAATKPGRMLYAKRSDGRTHNVTTTTGPPWIGSVMTGSTPYGSITATFQVPTVLAGEDGTTSTEASLWPGLGGFNSGSGSGLIQAGVSLQTTPTAATYLTWREYCCGDPDSNGYSGAFVPSPGDKILAQAWYCDANGQVNLGGGFGCSYLYDFQSGLVFSCTIPRGDPSNPPCWSVKALPLCSVSPRVPNCMTLGASAEFILENQSGQLSPQTDQFPPFTPAIAMSGTAVSTTGTSTVYSTVDNDPNVTLLADYPHGPPRIVVALTGNATTTFTALHPGEPLVSSVSSTPRGIQVFRLSKDQRVWTKFFDPQNLGPASLGGWSEWFPLGDGVFPNGSKVASVSSTPRGTQIFHLGLDNKVWTTFFDPQHLGPMSGGWVPWFPIGAGVFPPGSRIAAVSSTPRGTQIFVQGLDNKIWTTFFDPQNLGPISGGWVQWFPLGDNVFPPASKISAVSSTPRGTQIFVLGFDNKVWTTFFDPQNLGPMSGGWVPWFPMGDNVFPPHSAVAVVSSTPRGTQVFVPGFDNKVWTRFFDPQNIGPPSRAGWSDWFPLGGNVFPPGSELTALTSTQRGSQVFVPGFDGRIWTIFFDPQHPGPVSGGWSEWFPLGNNTFPSDATISAVSSTPRGSQLFVFGSDRQLNSIFFDPQNLGPVSGGWSNWFPL
jgi:hypothetical protein